MPKPGQAAETEEEVGTINLPDEERDAAAEAIPEELDEEPIETRDEAEGVLSQIDLRDLDLESMGIEMPVPRVGELCTRIVECSVRRLDDQKRTVVVINTAALDSYRTEIVPKGGDLKPYKKNPIVLINHDRYLVAGISKVQLRKGDPDTVLVATMEDSDWDMDDPVIVPWYNKVKRGFVRAASIGFIPLVVKRMLIDPEGEDRWDNWKWVIEKWILKEWSWVSVPSNSEALVEQRQADLHIQKLESQITDLGRKFDSLVRALSGDTSAIDATSMGLQEPGDADSEAADSERAAPEPASNVPSEPAAEGAPGEHPRSEQTNNLDPEAIVRAVQAALSPDSIKTALVASVLEIKEKRMRELGRA